MSKQCFLMVCLRESTIKYELIGRNLPLGLRARSRWLLLWGASCTTVRSAEPWGVTRAALSTKRQKLLPVQGCSCWGCLNTAVWPAVTGNKTGCSLQSQFVCKHRCIESLGTVSVSWKTGLRSELNLSDSTLSPFKAYCWETVLCMWLICAYCVHETC